MSLRRKAVHKASSRRSRRAYALARTSSSPRVSAETSFAACSRSTFGTKRAERPRRLAARPAPSCRCVGSGFREGTSTGPTRCPIRRNTQASRFSLKARIGLNARKSHGSTGRRGLLALRTPSA